jgi:AbiV family abortive infection protein
MAHQADSKARLRRFIEGAELIHANALALYEEAQTLGKGNSFARAAVLHQISMEECSKVDTLGAAVVSILAGLDVDEASLAKSLRSHSEKNHANVYNATPTEEELSARERRDWDAARAAFKNFQKDFHNAVNDIKNSGLYVDFKYGAFSAPSDAVNEETAVLCMALNADFLHRGENFVRLLRIIEADPERYTHIFKEFLIQTESTPLNDGRSADEIVQAIIEDMRSRLK